VAITLRRLIDELAGGVTGNGRLKAVVRGGVGGASSARRDRGHDGCRRAPQRRHDGGLSGRDRDGRDVSIPEALMVVARFYAHESCGQCTPCRESTG